MTVLVEERTLVELDDSFDRDRDPRGVEAGVLRWEMPVWRWQGLGDRHHLGKA